MKLRTPVLVVLVSLLAGCASVKRCMYAGGDRDSWQQPEEVIAALGLSPGDAVADVGAGGGYFTFRLADAVGPAGKVYAVDVDGSMVELLVSEASEQGRENVEGVVAGSEDPLIPKPVDLIFVSNTYHHLAAPAAYFRNAQKYLKPGGRVAIVEYAPDGPGLFEVFFGSHATDPEAILTEMGEAGFRLDEDPGFLSRQSFQIFVPGP